jgi:hypothetical protein
LCLAGFRWIVKGIAGAVAFGSFEEESLLEALREPDEAGFAIDVGPDFEIELMEATESVGDVNLHFGGIDWLAIGVGDGEVGGTGAQSGIDDGNGMRVGIKESSFPIDYRTHQYAAVGTEAQLDAEVVRKKIRG